MKDITLEEIERHNRGWLEAGNCPPARVFLDGVELRRVVAVNRRKGRVRVYDDPIKINKRGKAIISRTLYGAVRIELI